MNDPGAAFFAFWDKSSRDDRLLPSHISLFMAIYMLAKDVGPENAIKITRKKLMTLAKIKSISAYHRLISDLVIFGYIIYQPSYNHHHGSTVILNQ